MNKQIILSNLNDELHKYKRRKRNFWHKSNASFHGVSGWHSSNAKADWYDPTVSRKDELLGERDHSADDESKKPKHAGYYR